MKRIFLTTIGVICAVFFANAQSWQWGKRGGSSNAFTTPSITDESVADVATDPNGNIYILAYIETGSGTGADVDGYPIMGWGNRDILLTSFKCDGTYRWSKDLGSSGNDGPTNVKTDSLGGVYITGTINTNFTTIHLDTDTTWGTGNLLKSMFIAKYDTNGTYKWFIMPQADSITISGTTGFYDMDVDGAGNIFLLSTLAPGAYFGGAYVASTLGVCVLELNSAGIFQSSTPMQITFMGITPFLQFKRDHNNGKYCVTGRWGSTTGYSFGSTVINRPLSVGYFDSTGTCLWARQNTSTYGDNFNRPAIDGQHNIYLDGTASYFTTNDTFDTYILNNTLESYGNGPLVVKLDTNGNLVWGNFGSTNAASFADAIIVKDTETIIAGSYPGLLKWAGYADSIQRPVNCGYSVYITRFNSNTGVVLGMDSLLNTCLDGDVDAIAMVGDKKGNFYLGGYFAYQVTVNGTTLTKAGGVDDFFFAKYGTSNCNSPALAAPEISQKAGAIQVYPNPAADELNVTGIAQITAYRLLTITGVSLLQGVFKAGENTIQVQNCASGLYFLEMIGADGVRNEIKVVKQ